MFTRSVSCLLSVLLITSLSHAFLLFTTHSFALFLCSCLISFSALLTHTFFLPLFVSQFLAFLSLLFFTCMFFSLTLSLNTLRDDLKIEPVSSRCPVNRAGVLSGAPHTAYLTHGTQGRQRRPQSVPITTLCASSPRFLSILSSTRSPPSSTGSVRLLTEQHMHT